MVRRIALAAAMFAALGGCGSRADLKPAPGESLPPAPYGRAQAPDANELLQPDVQAVPARTVELRRKSEVRADDPFDLPPEG